MGDLLSPAECAAMFRLLATSADDLVIKADRRGRVVHCANAYGPLGDPTGRHLLELVHPSSAAAVRAEYRAAACGTGGGWTEVLALAEDGRELSMELRMAALTCGGALAILRSTAERRALEERLFAAAMTDPLTRLTNREAFVAMLDHLVERRAAGHLALFDLDHFRTLNLRHGHSGGDRVLIAFARLLRRLLRPDDLVSRIGGGTFGVLLPDAGASEAQHACAAIVSAIAEMNLGAHSAHRLTASAGIAPLTGSADACLRAAELALLSAKAHGRSRIAASAPRLPPALPRQAA